MAYGRWHIAILLAMVSATPSTGVPDVNIVYKMENFPGYAEVYCVTGDDGISLTSGLIPLGSGAPVATESESRINFPWSTSRYRASGLLCGCFGENCNNTHAKAPFVFKTAIFVPEHLSITLNQHEDLHLNFETAEFNKLQWQKEPFRNQNQKLERDVKDKTLFISASQLQGSGLYAMLKSGQYTLTNAGVVWVIVRDCPEQMYGADCLQWCPDCLHGGMCHPETGECVCPPGLAGHQCQTRCPANTIGKKCNIPIAGGGENICLPDPFGCICAPGFEGFRCDRGCSEGQWGADCRQTCSHCKGGCNVIDGTCDTLGPADCLEDVSEVGLPRLRKRPEVTHSGDKSVGIRFNAWRPGWDDGEMPPGATRTYVVKFWRKGDPDIHSQEVSPGHVEVTGLTPKTSYQGQVLVQVTRQDRRCVEDGTTLGRVHTIDFNTTCPPDPPMVEDLELTNITATTADMKWKSLPYLTDCNLEYCFKIIDTATKQNVVSKQCTTTAKGTAERLFPFRSYTVKVFSREKGNRRSESEATKQEFRTLPLEPTTPTIRVITSRKSISFRWHAEGNGTLVYQYRYKSKPVECKAERPFQTGNTSDERLEINSSPYSEIDVIVYASNEGGQSPEARHKFVTDGTVPASRVERLQCSSVELECSTTVEDSCENYNGPGMGVEYRLSPVNHERRVCQEKLGITSDTRFRGSPPSRKVEFNSLLNDTEYEVKAFPANSKGVAEDESLAKTSRVKTKPTAPLAVTSLTVSEAHDSVKVEWKEPDSCPPTGQLEKYVVTWKRKDNRHATEQTASVESETSLTINGLAVNKTYIISVSGKNIDVANNGEKIEIEATTQEGKPSIPENVSASEVTQNKISVEWKPPKIQAGNIVKYNIYIQEIGDRAREIHHTELYPPVETDDFDDLIPGQQYRISVDACNSKQCSDNSSLLLWTRPEPPTVKGELRRTDGPPSGITIALPYIEKPSSEHVENSQYIMIRESVEDTWHDQNLTSTVSSHISGQDTTSQGSPWISAFLLPEDIVRGSQREFTIGDNMTYNGFYNRPLVDGKSYDIAIVSVASVGPYHEYTISKARDVLAGPHSLSGLLLGVGIGIFLFIAMVRLVTIILFRRRKRQVIQQIGNRSRNIVQDRTELLPNEDSLISSLVSAHRNNKAMEMTELNLPRTQEQSTEPQERPEAIYEYVGRKVTVEQIEAYLARAINAMDLDVEFKSVPTMTTKCCSDGNHPRNLRKNRYEKILPYNETRVKLPLQPRDPFSDYINASYIKGHAGGTDYIATQGPKDIDDDTIGDFWRMIWHSGSNTIIMVANLKENGNEEVAQYWPDTVPIVKGGVNISLTSSEVKVEYIVRRMLITYQNEERVVLQYQYTAWPHHNVPNNAFGLAMMLSAIRERQAEGPIVVHCSAGIGRTGTVLLALYVLDQIDLSAYMDAHEALVQLRNGRPRLIENSFQYKFGHRILQEYLFGGQTSYSCGEFPKELPKLRQPVPPEDRSTLEYQYQKLKNLPKINNCNIAKNPVCSHLNRNPDILPDDNRLVFLRSMDDRLENRYINAMRVSSLERKDAYIVAEHPQRHTIQSMWSLVYTKRIPAWVLIQTFPADDENYPPVMREVVHQTIGTFKLTLTGKQSYPKFEEYHVEISVPPFKGASVHTCVLIMMKGWPHEDELPSSVQPLLAALERAESLADPKTSILLTDKDGVTATGVMLSLFLLVERIKLFQGVDIFRSVQDVVYARPQFITSLDQYDLLYTAAEVYLQAYNTYGNFN